MAYLGMERNEISRHEILIYSVLRNNSTRWLSNKEIAALVPTVAYRTVRAHTRKLVAAGLIDQAELFPGHRYKWSQKGEKRNLAYSLRLQQASEIFANSGIQQEEVQSNG